MGGMGEGSIEVRADQISMGSGDTESDSKQLECQTLPVSYTGHQRSTGCFQGWELIPVNAQKLGCLHFLVLLTTLIKKKNHVFHTALKVHVYS